MCGGFLVYNEKQRLWVRRRYVKQKVGISRNHGTWGNIFAGRMWRKRGQRTNGLDTEEMAGHDGCIVVGYAQVGSESDWRTTNTQSFKNIFTEENGYYLIFEDGQQKQENQVKAIRNFILQDVDYIILDPVVETGWEAVLEEAKEAGIPVILSDRTVEVGDESLYSCWVGSNFCEEGIKAGSGLKII